MSILSSSDDRRESQRLFATLKIRLHAIASDELMSLVTGDVSQGGFFVPTNVLLPRGAQVVFEIFLKGADGQVTGRAVVAWVRPFDPSNPSQKSGMGLKFTDLAPESAEVIKSWIEVHSGQVAQIEAAPIEAPTDDQNFDMLTFERVGKEESEDPFADAFASLENDVSTLSADAPVVEAESVVEGEPVIEGEPVVEGEALAEEEPMDLGEPMELGEPMAEAAEPTNVNEPAADVPPPLPEEPVQVPPRPTGDSGDMVTLPTAYSVNDTVIGIDLGTSNSCVAVIHEGKPYVIPSDSGEPTLPSIVSFTRKGETLVGKPARDQLVVDPKNTVYGAKRFIGRPFNSPIVQTLKSTFPYTIVPGEAGQVALQIRDQAVLLETISALILENLKKTAQEFIGLEVTKAIITVPAYYNDNQRQAVKEAGRMAGLDVQRIVNEPTSAALAYAFNRGLSSKVLVFDLGGGTFDVSVLELKGNTFNVIASGGNNFLGGEDFDNVIADHIIAVYEKENKIKIAPDPIIRQRIKQAAEFAKRFLSESQQAMVNVPYLKTAEGKGFNLQLPLTRETLNKITMHLVDRTLQICDDVIRCANLKKSDLKDVILVGGQTRMPLIRNRIHQHFGHAPYTDINPDEVVAVGAALLGGSMGQLDNLKLRDVISISIGIGLPGGRFKPIIKANEPVPTVKNYKIATAKNKQNELTIDIYQGEAPYVKDNEYLGTLLFSDLPKSSKGDTKMNIEFRVTDECILKVIATNPETGRTEEALLVTYDTPPSLKAALSSGDEDSEADSPLADS